MAQPLPQHYTKVNLSYNSPLSTSTSTLFKFGNITKDTLAAVELCPAIVSGIVSGSKVRGEGPGGGGGSTGSATGNTDLRQKD